jgi:acyl-CoA synthetase (AMP-forming)/AMP-acid ligase II
VVKEMEGDEPSGAGGSTTAGEAVPGQTRADGNGNERMIDITPGGGEVGEVWCRGPTVFSGYWEDQEGTQRAFAPGGWFKTGDLAQVSGWRRRAAALMQQVLTCWW